MCNLSHIMAHVMATVKVAHTYTPCSTVESSPEKNELVRQNSVSSFVLSGIYTYVFISKVKVVISMMSGGGAAPFLFFFLPSVGRAKRQAGGRADVEDTHLPRHRLRCRRRRCCCWGRRRWRVRASMAALSPARLRMRFGLHQLFVLLGPCSYIGSTNLRLR